MSKVIVRRADAEDIPRIAPLFDGYRQFYRQASDPARALAFLQDRSKGGDSIVFVAERDRKEPALGFAQVYPIFSSVRCAPAWILNDLFVAKSTRRQGVARMLIRAVASAARDAGAAYVELSTETGNANARALYEAEGYEHETGFEHYLLDLSTLDD